MTQITHDSIAMRGAGVVQIAQPARGHRFTLDSIILADFCRVKPRERVLEPGAGTGVISILLAKKNPRALFTPIEVQPDLHKLSEENRNTNGLENVIPVEGDVRTLPARLRRFAVIVTNPPYVKAGAGRTSLVAGRGIARQDHLAHIDRWLDLVKFLEQGGRYNIVFPALRMAELFSLMHERRLEPKRVRMVHPRADKPASVALVEAVKEGGAGLAVLPPLIVHEAGGGYTEEMKDIYGMPTDR